MNRVSRMMIGAIVLLTLLRHSTAGFEEFYPGERDAMIQLRESVKSTVIDLHSRWTGPPCIDNKSNWVGIVCSNSHVVHIVLDGYQLTGSLPPTFLEDITYLTMLSFRNNSLSGSLPSLTGLLHLRQIFLSHNLFSGSIPYHYINLPQLTGIQLEENILGGSIPPFDQPTLVVFNVSHNGLEGSIPQTPTLQRFGNDSYGSNLQLCGKPLGKPCAVAAPPPSPNQQGKKRLSIWSIVLIAGAAALLPFIIVFLLLCYFKKMHLLHESLPSHKVPHANLKSSNILICHHSNSNNNQIYLTDFGFLPLLPSRKDASEKLFVGRSPEFSQGKKLTHKADVYCFGIILLEVITGREVPERNDDPSIDDLADWVRSIVDYDWSTDILDLEIQGTNDTHDEMLKLAEIARDCVAWPSIQIEVRDFFELIAMRTDRQPPLHGKLSRLNHHTEQQREMRLSA